jgi:cysteinyl-tRNA synthetase
LLGILQEEPSSWFNDELKNIDKNKIDNLVATRQEAKAQKDYAKADLIRSELSKMGIIIKDTDSGTDWSIE